MMDVGKEANVANERASNSTNPADFISSILPTGITQRLVNMEGTVSYQEMADEQAMSQARRTAQGGDISPKDVRSRLEHNVELVNNTSSLNKAFEDLTISAKELKEGFDKMPGSGVASTAISGIADVVSHYLDLKLGKYALDKILGGGGKELGQKTIENIVKRAPQVIKDVSTKVGNVTKNAGGIVKNVATTVGRSLPAVGGFLSTPLSGIGATGAGGIAAASGLVAGAGITGWMIGSKLSDIGTDAYYNNKNQWYNQLNPAYRLASITDKISANKTKSAMEAIDRVSKTGKYTQNDIDAIVSLKQAGTLNGTWFGNRAEESSNIKSATDQLSQLAAIHNRKQTNAIASDQKKSNNINFAADSMNGIQRDQNGNPIIPNDPNQPLNKLVEINQEQLEVAKDKNKQDKELSEQQQALQQVTSKAAIHQRALSNVIMQNF
jgi:hypothetical protein